ncbi:MULTISPECIES: ABC transporter substrate-binding protein [unclassified Pseudocitrobacter]|uniref:ABC transporter substrate-binding protein n=1 Tax=unclassified Pseudocitrobacter TaxID=2638778 RepID=UPI0023E38D6C|nr:MULTISPECIES: ABC transporter substrate-binding protein [unclassified Pseudocitrobacter]MDF3828978.1 ABC transporter substrate-binding protein [Pseudocitrobacter sp. 2023EL-00150]MEC5374757.1 ABC transporter substrate-binding protein [Pseudocitrobacter sp. MW920760]
MIAKLTASALLMLSLSGCGPDEKPADETAKAPIKMWVAPNENEEAFWNVMVKEWNKDPAHTPVEFTTIPAANSSEEAIMNALASGTEPDLSSNIFIGFASQLDEIGQTEDLSKMPGYDELIKNRQMTNILPAWKLNGKQTVLPIYVNPIVWWWRGDLLKQYGFDHVPTRYDELYQLAEKRAQDNNGYTIQLTAGKNWWERWFDLIPLYYAQSGGQSYIVDNKTQFNDPSGLAVLTFMGKVFNSKWSSYDFTSADDPLASGQVLASARGPWDLARYRKQYPEVLKSIQIGPMLTENGTAHPHTFGDSKGMVIFNSSKHKAEAWAFMQWVFSNAEHDRTWLELTGMPPARADLLSNPTFVSYFDKNPLEKEIASWVDVALPPVATTQTTEIQRSMTQMLEEVIFNNTDPVKALEKSTQEINTLLAK